MNNRERFRSLLSFCLLYTSTAELQQKNGGKWNTIHDWEASGTNRISVSGPWYVVPGYSYRLQVTATTYDSDGNFIEAPVEYSPISDY